MAITHIQDSTLLAGSGTAVASNTLGSAVAAGDCIVVFEWNFSGTQQGPSSITDNAGNTWPASAAASVVDITPSDVSRTGTIWVLPNSNAKASGYQITANYASGTLATDLVVSAFRGVATTTPVNTTGTSNSGSAVSALSPTTGASITDAGDALVALCFVGSGANPVGLAVPTNYGTWAFAGVDQNDNSSLGGGGAWIVLSGATLAAKTANWTWSGGATDNCGASIVALKPASGGAAPFIVNPTAGTSSSMVRSVGAAFIAANLLTSTLAPNQIPLPVRNNDSVQILQQHGPGILKQTNADTSRGMPRTLRGADAKLPAQDAPFLQADALAVRWSRPDTSKGVPRTLIGPDATLPASDTPFLQSDPKALRQVVNTSIGTNPNLFVPPSAPPIGKAAAYTQPKLLWQPAGTSQSAYALQFAPSVAALPPGQQTPFIQPDRVHQVADTNSMYAAIFGDASPVPVIQPLLPQIRWAWQNGDTSDSVTAAITPTGPVALPPGQATPWSFIQYRWQDGDTSDSVTAVLPIPLPAGKATPQSDPADNRWRAQDSSQGTPKPLYADATTPFFVEPHTAPDRIRPITDTSTATNIAAIPPAAPPLPVGSQWVASAPVRFWFQPADSSQSLAKALTADATTPASNLQQPVPDRFHPVSDTTLSSPLALIHPSVAPPVIPKKGGHFIPKKIRHETFEPERFDQQKQAELRRTIEEQFDVPEVQQAVAKYISRPAKAPNLRPSLNWPEIYKNFANIERSLREFEQKRQFEQHQIELARQAEIQDEEDLLRFL